jgi:hypothetical protein
MRQVLRQSTADECYNARQCCVFRPTITPAGSTRLFARICSSLLLDRHHQLHGQYWRLRRQLSTVCYPLFMSASLESALLSVYQQSLIELKKSVDLAGESYPVGQTSKSKLKQIEFRFEDHQLRGIEQNPNTKSRWAKLARDGQKVMQFLEHGSYIAVVADGKVHLYKRS